MELGLLEGVGIGGAISFFALVGLLWVVAWKGWALWIAARKGSKPWFIALLVINTLGILEILYIFVFSKWGENKKDDGMISEAEIKEEIKKEESENSENTEEIKN